MAISNKQKRQLTCQFCPKHKDGCKCHKFWKEIYNQHREQILAIYHGSASATTGCENNSTLNEF